MVSSDDLSVLQADLLAGSRSHCQAQLLTRRLQFPHPLPHIRCMATWRHSDSNSMTSEEGRLNGETRSYVHQASAGGARWQDALSAHQLSGEVFAHEDLQDEAGRADRTKACTVSAHASWMARHDAMPDFEAARLAVMHAEHQSCRMSPAIGSALQAQQVLAMPCEQGNSTYVMLRAANLVVPRVFSMALSSRTSDPEGPGGMALSARLADKSEDNLRLSAGGQPLAPGSNSSHHLSSGGSAQRDGTASPDSRPLSSPTGKLVDSYHQMRSTIGSWLNRSQPSCSIASGLSPSHLLSSLSAGAHALAPPTADAPTAAREERVLPRSHQSKGRSHRFWRILAGKSTCVLAVEQPPAQLQPETETCRACLVSPSPSVDRAQLLMHCLGAEVVPTRIAFNLIPRSASPVPVACHPPRREDSPCRLREPQPLKTWPYCLRAAEDGRHSRE